MLGFSCAVCARCLKQTVLEVRDARVTSANGSTCCMTEFGKVLAETICIFGNLASCLLHCLATSLLWVLSNGKSERDRSQASESACMQRYMTKIFDMAGACQLESGTAEA